MKVKVEDVLDLLTKQKFADWYNDGNFAKWLSGDLPKSERKSKIEILTELSKMLKKKTAKSVPKELANQIKKFMGTDDLNTDENRKVIRELVEVVLQ